VPEDQNHEGAAHSTPKADPTKFSIDGCPALTKPASAQRTYQERRLLNAAPIPGARIEDLGRGDVVKVDCAACHHAALLTPDFLLRLGLSPNAKVLDLKARMRSEGPSSRVGQAGTTGRVEPGCPLWRRQAGPDAGRPGSARRGLGPQSYRKKAEASQATASQAAAQNPSDTSNTMVKDPPSDH